MRASKPGDNGNRLHCFVLQFEKTKYTLQADSKLEKEEWMESINQYQKESVTSDDNYKKIKGTLKK